MGRKRERKYSDHALKMVREKLREKHLSIVSEIDALSKSELLKKQQQINSAASLHVVRGYDLRGSLEEKSLDVHKLAKYTAFVNRAHTLVHIVPRDGDCHLRIPLYRSLAYRSDEYLTGILLGRIADRLVL